MAFVLTVPPAALIEGRRLFLEPVVDFFFRLIVTVKPFAGRAFGHASKTDDSQIGSAVFFRSKFIACGPLSARNRPAKRRSRDLSR